MAWVNAIMAIYEKYMRYVTTAHTVYS
jgi:hypothetical protein